MSRLRSALGPAGDRLLTRPPGYMLQVAVEELDAERFERSYADARAALAAGDAPRGAALLRESETLWRGPPLAEFTYEPFAQATIARLEELRLSAREELIDAELMLGHHAEVVSELEALVREQPLRERPRGQLMLALYRCGRQADALDAFRQARRMLVDELAVEPSNALRELERAILRQDASLQAPSQPAPAVPAHRADDPQVAASDQGSDTIVRKTATVLAARLTASGPADPEVARVLIARARAGGGADRASPWRRVRVRTRGRAGGDLRRAADPGGRCPAGAACSRRASRARIAALSADGPGELVVGVGVDTGEVVVEAPDEVFGEPLNGAIGLARGAANQEVLLSRRNAPPGVRRDLDRAGTRRSWLATAGPRRRRAGVPRRLHSPMVGRDDELAAAPECFRAGRPRARHPTADGDRRSRDRQVTARPGAHRRARRSRRPFSPAVACLTAKASPSGHCARRSLRRPAGSRGTRSGDCSMTRRTPTSSRTSSPLRSAWHRLRASASRSRGRFGRLLEVLASRRPRVARDRGRPLGRARRCSI